MEKKGRKRKKHSNTRIDLGNCNRKVSICHIRMIEGKLNAQVEESDSYVSVPRRECFQAPWGKSEDRSSSKIEQFSLEHTLLRQHYYARLKFPFALLVSVSAIPRVTPSIHIRIPELSL